MLSQVTVAAVAAPLAVVSALLALVFLRYGIPRAARNGPNRNGQETVGISVLLCAGNVGLVVSFLLFVVPRVTGGFDPPVFGLFLTTSPTTQPPSCPQCDPEVDPNAILAGLMLTTLFVALIWYTLSIAVLAIEMSAGRSRGQR
jgi:hypothetical protein